MLFVKSKRRLKNAVADLLQYGIAGLSFDDTFLLSRHRDDAEPLTSEALHLDSELN